ncbi:MAG: hypothetical protein K2Y56_12745 [Methylobacterium sp.]|uniref:ATP-binding protein n=1 Tax=Methylobacterium sp. TaxID=409 RepID=UPI0025EEC2FA|nr:ATP-binding protein [Methylobacterium sp.]MBX9932387.1 hypothetical protein [Methylobacterium sp.]
MSEVLRRSLGEAVMMETVLAAGLRRTKAVGNHLESAILNLALNARDAMPEGGRLTIETANAHLDEVYGEGYADVASGQYVTIAVTDMGSGMTSDVVECAFDPFFTRKSVGRSTGPGLSQVYGFVKQSGGHVKIYLSRLVGLDQPAKLPEVALAALPESKRREITGAVEDDVRRVAVEALRDLYYTIVHPDGAMGALSLLDCFADVSLLFTDAVMPDCEGRKLAEETRRRRPDLHVLYTTGYSRNAIVHNGGVDADVRLLGKPYTLEQPAATVRRAMSEKAA